MHSLIGFIAASLLAVTTLSGQPPEVSPRPGSEPETPDGPMGPGGPRMGPGGIGGPMGQDRKLVKTYDKDGDKRLNTAERAEARAAVKKESSDRPSRMRGPGGGGEKTYKPGIAVRPQEVAPQTGDLYDVSILRTIFLDFEATDWESELEDFTNSDVDIPATLTVDGKAYPGVGVHFRGSSSLFSVGTGGKRSFNIAMDFTHDKQVIASASGKGSYKTLNLLNSNGDPSFMSSVLYSQIANRYIAAPRANFVRLVVNGESWGVYVNVEQFNADFVKRAFKDDGKGARWKVKGSPGARSGLEFTGDDPAQYKRKFEIKSKDSDESWDALIQLCKVLNTTAPDRLKAELEPILDIDGVLKFLALDVVLANSDGYWTRASDYSLYRDAKGVFHIVPHDMNEAFRASSGGPGMGRPGGGRRQGPRGGNAKAEGSIGSPVFAAQPPMGGPGGGGGGGNSSDLDPLIGLSDTTKPLRSKLLAVPELRERYMLFVRQIASSDLDWKTLGPIVASHRALIENEIEADTRKLTTFEAFKASTSDDGKVPSGVRAGVNLRAFADKRRAYLAAYQPRVPASNGTAENRRARENP